MSDTPRVDDFAEFHRKYSPSVIPQGILILARQLERELAAMTKDRDMWLADDVKQNAALGRAIAARSAVTEVGSLSCGHHVSLLVESVESDYQYCDLCECRKRRNDAEEMERTHLAKLNKGNANAARYQFLRSDQHTFAVFMPRQHGHIAFMEEGLDEKIDEAIRKRTDMNNGEEEKP